MYTTKNEIIRGSWRQMCRLLVTKLPPSRDRCLTNLSRSAFPVVLCWLPLARRWFRNRVANGELLCSCAVCVLKQLFKLDVSKQGLGLRAMKILKADTVTVRIEYNIIVYTDSEWIATILTRSMQITGFKLEKDFFDFFQWLFFLVFTFCADLTQILFDR